MKEEAGVLEAIWKGQSVALRSSQYANTKVRKAIQGPLGHVTPTSSSPISQAGCLWAYKWIDLVLSECEQLALSQAVLQDSVIFSFFLGPKLLGPSELLSVQV